MSIYYNIINYIIFNIKIYNMIWDIILNNNNMYIYIYIYEIYIYNINNKMR